ncbi:ABC transporter permease [Cohnella endophytica]|uniref:ABC transporter permease n=1 Tax=Cohnella endophytica TaxID=2419778 RepID=A0A494XXU9_9BACL|nr:FtsX-like permease family protein [Cohnella endophytica]RKP52914.1 ABC transporter permease [Cohnella endophytica]
MALFVMIIRKMVQNKWLMSSMFLGILMTVALVGTMPIYSEAILSRMLVKDFEASQSEKGVYPVTYWSKIEFAKETNEKRTKIITQLDRFMATEAAPGFGIPVKELVHERSTKYFSFTPAGMALETGKSQDTSFRAFNGLEDHIMLKDGRMPAKQPVDGVYEVLVTDKALGNFKAVLNTVFLIKDDKNSKALKFKPVGVFTKKENDDPYFRNSDLSELNSAFVIDDSLFAQEFIAGNRISVTNSSWFIVLDYSKMELRDVDHYLATDTKIRKQVTGTIARSEFVTPALPIITEYFERAKRLNKLMWSLNVPVIIMIGFYMFMVSNLIVSRQKNEIAILRSRGATRWQVMLSFAIEGALLCVIAWVAGPFIGMGLTKVLGASNGFLEFVQRSKMPVHLNNQAYLYGGIAAGASFLMMLIPVFLATRVSIVGHKQELARMNRMPFWHKTFLDLAALAVSIYGLMTFNSRLKDLKSLGLDSDDLRVDPLQFVMPALFVLGAGLLLLRLYPYVLRLVYWIGRKWWPPSVYATLIQVGRSNSQYQYLMVFLIMTIAIGVFSSGAARTINNNTEDRIRYGSGADFVLQTQWQNDKPPLNAPSTESTATPKIVHYLEPSFDPYTKLPGVEQAAKVFVKEKATFESGEKTGTATLIGVDSDDFGRVSWFPNKLLDYPFYEYMNLIAADSRAVLISKTLALQKKLKQGDTIYVGWDNVSPQPFVVFGIIDYFPTFNPNPPIGSVDASKEDAKENSPMLIVGSLSRIQFQLGLEPYQVWLKMKPEYSTSELYEGIEKSKISLIGIVNTRENLSKAKNDPFLMALNGILTLGFMISILISFVGFLLYWILSLKGRALQNGILRAIGLSLRQLIGMLAIEQLLTSGVAILIGVAIGNTASRLFVPNFQIVFNPASLVPPFRVMFDAVDFIRLYSIVVFMLLLGLGILSVMLSRIRVHQTLKLGED